MTNFSCIAVGINRYQFVEPLNYAEADAQGLVKFLVEEVGVPREKCLLLTDSTSGAAPQSCYPNFTNLSAWLNTTEETLPGGDWFWVFFSGHGVHWRGEDYLLPIDGNLADLPSQAISARTLLTALKQRGTNKILLCLDINRSPGLGSITPVGGQFSQLAAELEINLIQSVSPQEYAYERRELAHGLFAAALGEALSYHRNELTLQNLSQYLINRLPELGNHHGTPQQHPLIQFAKTANQTEIILPAGSRTGQRGQIPVPTVLGVNGNGNGNPVRYRSGVEPSPLPKQDTKIQPEGTAIQPPNTKIQPDNNNSIPAPAATNSNPTIKQPAKNSSKNKSKTMTKPDKSNSALFWIGGASLLFLLMVLAVLWRNIGIFSGAGQPEAIASPSPQNNASPANPNPNAALSPKPTTPPTVNPVPAISPSAVVPTPTPQSTSQPTAQQPNTLTKASPTVDPNNRLMSNQATLENARGLLQSDRVTQFAQAIKVASQVAPGDPLYDQAQTDITRWSTVIMDMAHGRAKAGDWRGAITTAQSLPEVNQRIYKDAQNWIKRWQQLIQQNDTNLQQIQKARRLLRPNQATPYRQAIDTLKSIPAGQPDYELAQELTNTWMTEIWQIAQNRANSGDFKGAIAAANLLPENTPLATQAQKMITLWQQGKKTP